MPSVPESIDVPPSWALRKYSLWHSQICQSVTARLWHTHIMTHMPAAEVSHLLMAGWSVQHTSRSAPLYSSLAVPNIVIKQVDDRDWA